SGADRPREWRVTRADRVRLLDSNDRSARPDARHGGEGSPRWGRGPRDPRAAWPAACPDDRREASRIMVGSAKPSGQVPPAGEERTLGKQNASVQTRDTPPATPNPRGEVVAIRYGVIERTPLEWTWSWRVTVHKSGKTARVNVRIEFIEFPGSTRRIVGLEGLW